MTFIGLNMEITKQLKLKVIKVLLNQEDLFSSFESNADLVEFLDDILNLSSLPSTDNRYKDAYGDAYKHLVNNDDWDYEEVFLNRFNFVDNNDNFIKLLNKIAHPNLRQTEESISKYVSLLNGYLQKEGLTFAIESYDDNSSLPVYQLEKFVKEDAKPIDVVRNKIEFFVDNDPNGRFYVQGSHKAPPTFPSFMLVNDPTWNDYGNFSTYQLFYYTDSQTCHDIGQLKIICKNVGNTPDRLVDSFTCLNKDFCSLGINYDYYKQLKLNFPQIYISILWALKDSAYFVDIRENFEDESQFINSLIRYNEQERVLRETQYQLLDYDLDNLYSFQYLYKPNFSDESVEIDFSFNANKDIPNRIFALIGKNGVGKTQLITSLPFDIANAKDDVFQPRTPLFSKVIAVSYSAFDSFEIPQKKTSSFNYIHCGLKKDNGESYTEKGLKLRFHQSWKKIKKRRISESQGMFPLWRKLLYKFIDRSLVDEFIIEDEMAFEKEVNIEKFNKVIKKLSSGQSIILYIITEIVANIRYDSLIIYDEPETHLHPNAISELLNTIFALTQNFQSYCILATHSPLIIRELLSKNVYIMEREENVLSIRKPRYETFGENLTVITEDVFGNREIPNQYKEILHNLVVKGKSFDEIMELISSERVPVSLNTRIYLKSIINDKFENI